MRNILVLLFLNTIYGPWAHAQDLTGESCSLSKQLYFTNSKKNARMAYPGDSKIDIKYHRIKLNIDYNSKFLAGSVFTTFTAKENITEATFDLSNELKVDSILSNGKKLNLAQSNNQVKITLEKTLKTNEKLSLEIFYKGNPKTSAFGSFSFGTHGNTKSPVVWSLSEPYGAPDWWPCKDDPSDKIDSTEVWITMPSGYVSVSNGLLKSVENSLNNKKTYIWKNSNPISHYLISIACSDYQLYENTFSYNGKSMPVSHYIYPEILTASIKNQLNQTNDMLTFFSNTFGEYPFMNEKYGHVMCNFSGGMEHQTISSMGAFSEDLISHELAHQWFGDKITCKTWSDIFMNEAFASYSEALFQEHKYGAANYLATINGHITRAKKVTEPIYISNPADENLIFNYALTYSKGAVVLHMLRGVLGSEVFFKTLKNFQNSEFAYKAASIDDFRKIAEQTSGKDLKYFFDEWIYGISYPKYQFAWNQISTNTIKMQVSQQAKNSNPAFFKMPIEFKLIFESGREQTVDYFIDELTKNIEIKDLTEKVKSITFDPNNLIMKDVSTSNVITSLNPNLKEFEIYPNPSFDKINMNLYYEKAEIINARGNIMKSFFENEIIKTEFLPAGHYILRLYANGNFDSKHFIKN